MTLAIPLAWLQLKREKLRLLIALAGVGFAVVLIFMQLGFQNALYDSSVRYHHIFIYDLAMISPRTYFIVQPEGFSRRRLIQVLGIPGVESVAPVYIGQAGWRNPENPSEMRNVFVVGFDPSDRVLALPEVEENLDQLLLPDRVLYDARSRAEFGPIAELYRENGPLEVEVANRTLEVVGLFELGTSFGIDAAIITSDLNLRRLFPGWEAGRVSLGLIRLEPGRDPEAMRETIAASIPKDVEILTPEAYVEREIDYWRSSTPIGYVFSFGVIIGLTVGGIIVYQILFADVSDHLAEYATLKAMGYTDGYLAWVVLQEAAILAVLGFIPGLLVSLFLYDTAGEATALPLVMTVEVGVLVLLLTVVMCAVSGIIAMRRIRSADPAEIF
jgi:putative ABC transport system permease protein